MKNWQVCNGFKWHWTNVDEEYVTANPFSSIDIIAAGLPRHREDREFRCSFFQTGKSQKICLNRSPSQKKKSEKNIIIIKYFKIAWKKYMSSVTIFNFTIFKYVLIIKLLIKYYYFGILVCDNQMKPPTLNSGEYTNTFGHPIPGPASFSCSFWENLAEL